MIYGGRAKTRSLNHILVLNLSNFNWQEVRTHGHIPPPRFAHCAAVVKDKIYIFGGLTHKKGFSDPCFCVLELDQDNAKKLSRKYERMRNAKRQLRFKLIMAARIRIDAKIKYEAQFAQQ